MKYSDRSDILNEDIIACYPRRIEKSKDYEVWKSPYVKKILFMKIV